MLEIEKIVPGGQGLGTLEDGRKIFLWNALPGEIVSDFTVTKRKAHYLEGVATRISRESGYRVLPKDACYLATSPWQIMSYSYELIQKREIVLENFRQVGIDICEESQDLHFGDASSRPSLRGSSLISLPLSRTLQNTNSCDSSIYTDGALHSYLGLDLNSCYTDGVQYFYRNKMEYSLYWDNSSSKIRLAFHSRGSHRKIPITQSSIEREAVFQAASRIVSDLNSRGASARTYQSLLLRCDQSGTVSGGLYENGQPHPTFDNLSDTILGYSYSYSPNGFFQINLPVYEMALREIKAHILTDTVLDLYSGVGSIGLSVARDKKLVLVENNKFAYGEMMENIPKGSSLITGVLANSEDALDYIEAEQTVIVDPPRAGCDVKLLERLLAVRPRRIIYLSCNPATQARDVKILQSKYIISDIKTFNFFPRTPHIENLVVLDISQDE